MKCQVCGKEFDAAECPRCGFPDIQIPEVGREQALASLMPTINNWRSKFLNNIRVELVCYQWKAEGDKVVPNGRELKLLGTGEDLRKGAQWLDQWFARIPEQAKLTVTVMITAGQEKREQQIAVRNLTQPELQQIGAYLDDDFRLHLRLRNASEAVVDADPVPLFV